LDRFLGTKELTVSDEQNGLCLVSNLLLNKITKVKEAKQLETVTSIVSTPRH